MGRTRGALNADYAEQKTKLARSLRGRLLRADGATASLRELATAAGVSVATLRHYFGDRDGVLAAALDQFGFDGAQYVLQAATEDHGPVSESLRWLLHRIAMGWQLGGLQHLHALGLTAGLGNARLGPVYVSRILEPTLSAVEARLNRHIATGELPSMEVRFAALELISPLLLGLIHQFGLFGSQCRPLDLNAFIEHLATRFLMAHATELPDKRSP